MSTKPTALSSFLRCQAKALVENAGDRLVAAAYIAAAELLDLNGEFSHHHAANTLVARRRLAEYLLCVLDEDAIDIADLDEARLIARIREHRPNLRLWFREGDAKILDAIARGEA